MILWIGGIALAGYAYFVFDPSVSAAPFGYGRVVNADLQQRQMMMLIAGCALFIVGAIMHAIGANKALAGSSGSVWQAYKDEVKRRGEATGAAAVNAVDEEIAAQEADSRAFMESQRR
ncbi:hypothetical protein ACXY7D_09360 [Sphingomonas melonis]